MRIAIVGSGISGLTAAYLLKQKYQVTVFEASAELGGHTATKSIDYEGKEYAVDTGFIVFNDWTYPNFIRLLNKLGVESQATEMGFSVFKSDGSFYYAGNNFNSLFAKRRLLFSRQHWQLLKDIVRFNRDAVADWQAGRLTPELTLGEYLYQNNYSEAFCSRYLIPMGAAIWSSSTVDMRAFPALFFVEFFHNHGLLSINKRPVWRVIKGGSAQYLKPLVASFKEHIHLQEAVRGVVRTTQGVEVTTDKAQYAFDHVVFACHSDQVLNLLTDPTVAETQILGAIPYRENKVTLHHDERLLPESKRAWASWNYCLDGDSEQLPILTYNMNLLQGIQAPTTFCVTLNANHYINPNKVLGQFQYAHPVFTPKGLAAQQQWQEINRGQSSYCGAYWFNGFHEDGVNSALRVAQKLGVDF